MLCVKCQSSEMYVEYDRLIGIRIYACFMCGKRIYESYPERYGNSQEDKKWLDEVFQTIIANFQRYSKTPATGKVKRNAVEG